MANAPDQYVLVAALAVLHMLCRAQGKARLFVLGCMCHQMRTQLNSLAAVHCWTARQLDRGSVVMVVLLHPVSDAPVAFT